MRWCSPLFCFSFNFKRQQMVQFTKLEASTTLQCELEKLSVSAARTVAPHLHRTTHHHRLRVQLSFLMMQRTLYLALLDRRKVAHTEHLEALARETPTPRRKTPIDSDAGPQTDSESLRTPFGYTRVPGFGLVPHEPGAVEPATPKPVSGLPQRAQRKPTTTYG